MNNQLRSLYVAILDNEVVCVDTNLQAFHKEFSKIEPDFYHYRTLSRKFTPSVDRFQLILSGKAYYFQKLV